MQKKIMLFLATGGGVGYLPGAPGTYGSVVGVLLYWGLQGLALSHFLLFIAIFTLLAIWIANFAEQSFQEEDSGKIVIDEIVGFLATMAFIPFDWKWILTGFAAFRLFDILKPFPIRILDQKVGGGLGIVLDDLAAGIFANLFLQILSRVLT